MWSEFLEKSGHSFWNPQSRLKVKLEAALQFLAEHPQRKRVHLHEQDADWQKDRSRGFVVGYNAQLAVDSKSQMIVHEEVVVDQADSHQTVAVVEAIEAKKAELCQSKTDEVKYVLDCGYFQRGEPEGAAAP